MDRMLLGKLFQSEGALNMKDFFAKDLEAAGTEKKSWTVCLRRWVEEKGTKNCLDNKDSQNVYI